MGSVDMRETLDVMPRNPEKPARISTRLGHTQQQPVRQLEGPVAMSEPWLSADDIAAHLGVTKDTVYSWISDKAMPAHKVGRLWKFQASEVDAWVRRGDAAVADDAPPSG